MSHFITLDQLGYQLPDGTPLFKDITLSFTPGLTGLVGANGVGKSTLLRLIKGSLQPSQGHVNASGKLALLQQQLSVSPGGTVADSLGLTEQLAIIERMLSGEGSLEDAERADWTLTARLEQAFEDVGLPELDTSRPLGTLSGGQRTRLRLAGLMLSEPDILLMDEPTNDLDTEGCQILYDFLTNWQGPALIVSHDRTLLDQMDAIVALSANGISLYGGNYSFYKMKLEEERALAARKLESAKSNLAQVQKRSVAETEKKARRDARGRKSRSTGSQPKMLLNVMKERAEASGGKAGMQAEALEQKMKSAVDAAAKKLDARTPVRIDIPPSGLLAGRHVLTLQKVCWSPDGRTRVLEDVSFEMAGPARLALKGPNGCGKSSLLRLITGAVSPTSGTVKLADLHVAYLDQTMRFLDGAQSIAGNMERLNPALTQNQTRAALACFGFRADAANRSVGTLSGGETLRAGLACTFAGQPPQLMLLDEPTNHLDLDTVEMLEAALKAYDGALIVVSHDEAFLKAIGSTATVALGKRQRTP